MQKMERWIAILALVVSAATATIYFFQLQVLKEQLVVMRSQVKSVSDEVFKPRLEILSPYADQGVAYPLGMVSGRVSGNIPGGYVVLVGHRELAENGIAIRLDRKATVLADNTFKAADIYLGAPDLGAGATFELSAMIVSKTTYDGLDIGEGGKAFQQLPPSIANTTILVKRI